MERFSGYTKQMETTVVRTTHRVMFRLGERQVDLIDSLKHVPPKAKIIDISEGDSESETYPYIVFEEERAANSMPSSGAQGEGQSDRRPESTSR